MPDHVPLPKALFCQRCGEKWSLMSACFCSTLYGSGWWVEYDDDSRGSIGTEQET